MSGFAQDLEQTLNQSFAKSFAEAVTAQARQQVSQSLFNWLSFTARKKAGVDLEARLEEMRKRFDVLAENFQLRYGDGKLVVRVSGDAENTLRMLERGTDWFDPAEDATAIIVGAVLD